MVLLLLLLACAHASHMRRVRLLRRRWLLVAAARGVLLRLLLLVTILLDGHPVLVVHLLWRLVAVVHHEARGQITAATAIAAVVIVESVGRSLSAVGICAAMCCVLMGCRGRIVTTGSRLRRIVLHEVCIVVVLIGSFLRLLLLMLRLLLLRLLHVKLFDALFVVARGGVCAFVLVLRIGVRVSVQALVQLGCLGVM